MNLGLLIQNAVRFDGQCTFKNLFAIPFSGYNAQRINVTSFSSISYWSNREYWTQKCTQIGNIHSIILDVYVEKQSAQNFPFNSPQRKLDKNLMLSLIFPWHLYNNNNSKINCLTLFRLLFGTTRKGEDGFPDQV